MNKKKVRITFAIFVVTFLNETNADGLMENFIFTIQFCQSPCVWSILGNLFSSDTHIHRMKKKRTSFLFFSPSKKENVTIHHNYITNRACHKENVY